MAYSNFFPVFDLETGGLVTKGECSPITEIAICVVDQNLQDFEEYCTLVVPYAPQDQYNPKALEVSNITLEMCEKDGIDPKKAAKEVMDVFKRAKAKDGGKKPILVGHNIDDFDIPILTCFLNKFGFDLEKVVETKITVDTKWWGRLSYPHLPGFTLGDCLTAEGIDIMQAHRALHDTRATKNLFVEMLKRLRGQGNNILMEKPSTRDSFRFQISNR